MRKAIIKLLKNIKYSLSVDFREKDQKLIERSEQINISTSALEKKVEEQAELINGLLKEDKEHTESIDGLSKAEKDHAGSINVLLNENEFLLTRLFDRDNWLCQNKDKYKGKRCFLLGTGPSINSTDLGKLANEYTMGVNGICLLKDLQLNFYMSVSYYWWKDHAEAIKKHKCERKFFPRYLSELESDSTPISWLRTIEHKNYRRVSSQQPWFFSTEADRYVCLQGTVITVALQVLYYLGFDQVILLGIDHNYNLDKKAVEENKYMVQTSKLPHFLGDYYKSDQPVHVDIDAMERGYELARNAFESYDRKILNATPGTKLDIFEKVVYKSLF